MNNKSRERETIYLRKMYNADYMSGISKILKTIHNKSREKVKTRCKNGME